MAATTLSGLQAGLPTQIRPEQATSILTKAAEDSIVQKLSGQTPMPLTGSSMVVQTGHIEAGVVGEGQAKPVGQTSYSTKSIKPLKVAAIAVVSEELTLADPLRVVENIQGDLSGAITRAVDSLVINGIDPRTGNRIAGYEYVTQTANSVTLGTASKADGGIVGDLLAGYDLVTNSGAYNDDFTAFAADSRLRAQLMRATDLQGRPVFQQSVDLKAGLDNVLGLPAAYGKAVSGRVGKGTDSGVRAIGGDWNALKYGFALNLTIRKSTEATVVDGDTTYNLWQDNMVAYLVEAIFGWVITDTNSFVKYVAPTGGGHG